MDFRFTEEDEAFRKEVREFIQKESPPGWEGYGYLFDFPDNLWDLRAEIGKKSMAKGWGPGGHLTPVQHLIVQEAGAYYGIPGLPIPMMGEMIVKAKGTEEQKKRFLPIFAGGEVTFCGLGLSEPNAGSDLASLQTRAVRDGDNYIINGQKCWQSEAHHAEWTLLLVRTNPDVAKQKGLSLFLVDMRSPGITIQLIENCYRDKIFADVFYEDVKVPAENLIGGENNGWMVAASLLAAERGGIERIAASQRMFDELVKYVKATKRKGEILAKDPLIRQKLAQLHVEIETGRWFVYRVCWMQSQGLTPGIETSVSKVYGGELVQRLGRVATEILGLHSQLTRDSKKTVLGGKIPYWSLHTLCRTLGGGSSEMQRNIIARGLGLPRS
ncbi:acyl-CoA dehydrogenase family protein [Chloroflexota bacterium]